MNGRTNAKNSAGAIRDGCAVLEVIAPAYSQITAVRADGLTKRQNKGYIDSNNNDYWSYYIIIQKFELSNLIWTVTALGTEMASEAITIDNSKYYQLLYPLYIIKDGIILIQPTMKLGAVLTENQSEGYALLTESANNVFSFLQIPINDGLPYGKFNLNLKQDSSAIYYNQSPGIGYSLAEPSMSASVGSVSPMEAYTPLATDSSSNTRVNFSSSNNPYTVTIKTTDLTTNKYVWVASGGGSGYKGNVYIKDLWLSR